MDQEDNPLSPFWTGKRILLWCVLLLLLVINLGRSSQIVQVFHSLPDFVEYWTAVRVFVDGGNPYGAAELLEAQIKAGWNRPEPLMMWNPPWILPLLLPLNFLSFPVARFLWLLAAGIIFVCAADFVWRSFGGPVHRRWMSWIAAMLFLPIPQSLSLGQASPLILLGLYGFLWSLKRNRLWAAGAFMTLIALKPHLLYLFWVFGILWIFKTKKYRVLWGATGTLALLSAVVFLLNPGAFANYWRAVSSMDGPTVWQTPTWGVVLAVLFPGCGKWVRFVPSLLGLGIALLLWRKWRGNLSLESWCIAIPLLSVITGSFSWSFDWVVLMPAMLYLIRWFQEFPRQRWGILVPLAIMQPALHLTDHLTHSNFYALWYPLLLGWLYMYSNKRFLLKSKTQNVVLSN